jgi:hypothetical protein
MTENSRRKFLKQSGAGVAATAALPIAGALRINKIDAAGSLPPHCAIDLPGVHAYADRQSVFAGETIRFHVSSDAPYRLSVRKLGAKPDDPSSDQTLHTFKRSPAFSQSIHPGSYVYVESGLPAQRRLRALTLECWVRPWQTDRPQALIGQFDFPDACGYGLALNAGGEVEFYLGDGGRCRESCLHAGAKLQQRKWHHVVGVWDGTTKSLWVDGARVGLWQVKESVKAGAAPLRIGACGQGGVTDRFLEGDVAMPVIYERALAEEEIRERFAQKASIAASGKGVAACWPLDEEKGERSADASGNNRHGRIVNHATWMIGGPAFDGEQVPRYGPYDPAQDSSRGHGLRFAGDDLYDCHWRATHQYRVPGNAKPGIYVARIDFESEGKPAVYYASFIVRKARQRPKAPILVLCSTNTWRAYALMPFAKNQWPFPVWRSRVQTNSHAQAPAFSCYFNHHAGQPTYQLGLRVPWPNAGPDVLYNDLGNGFGQWTRMERFLHIWLDQAGYDYDVVADIDLHRDPAMLAGYQTLIINGHSEYWSIEAYEGVDRYLRNGGNVIVLSGNSMFWRVSFNEDHSVMECRKYDDRIGGRDGASFGELYHSHDGRRGSLMRECGHPAWRVTGLDTLGWAVARAEDFGVYTTDEPDHFLFHRPERVGLAKGETFGHAPGNDDKAPRSVGHEWDVRVTTLRKVTTNIPAGAALPEEPPGITTLARGVRKAKGRSDVYLDYFTAGTPAPESDEGLLAAEMIYWERPEGGRVFNAGAVAAGWGLAVDPKFQALMRNVLHHFGVKPTRLKEAK